MDAAQVAPAERYEKMRQRAETAEASLAKCQHDFAEMIERKEVMRNAWEGAEAELATMKTPCVWTPTDFGFESSCHYLTTYTADEFLFCPGCGHPVQVAE